MLRWTPHYFRDTDWIGRWYDVIGSLGRNQTTMLRRGLWNAHAQEFELEDIHDFAHASMDGAGALVTLLRELGDTTAAFPTGRHRAPSLLRVPRLVIRAQSLMDQARARWSFGGWDGRQPDVSAFHVLVYDERDTTAIRDYCTEHRVSINSLLACVLQGAAAELLDEPDSRQAWFVPVNMRGGVRKADPAMNQCSAVPLFVARGDRPETVHAQLRRHLHAHVHWGNWWAYTLGGLLGKRRMTRLYQRYTDRTFWMGTLSDMGRWTTGADYRPLGHNEVWYAAPPGCQNYPISCVPFVVNGRMTITIKVHPSISPDDHASRSLAVRVDRGLRDTLRYPVSQAI